MLGDIPAVNNATDVDKHVYVFYDRGKEMHFGVLLGPPHADVARLLCEWHTVDAFRALTSWEVDTGKFMEWLAAAKGFQTPSWSIVDV